MKTWKKPEVSKTSICEIGRELTSEELNETNGGFVGVCVYIGIGGDWDTLEVVKKPLLCYVVGR